MIKPRRKTRNYIDNQKFLDAIVLHKKLVKEALEAGKEKPRISEYIGKCIWLIAENLAMKPRFMNYSFVDEMKSDAIENCILYFDNFDPSITQNPFSYFTQVTYFAFHRRINLEEKKRYVIYKKFQESILDSTDSNLFVDSNDSNLLSPAVYDNINDSIRRFEDKEAKKKEKRKQTKEGLLKFVED
jgi:hypothetical protein